MQNSSTDSIGIEVESVPFQQIPNWILDEVVSAQAIRLYAILRRQGDNKRRTSYYSRKKIAIQMQCSPATMDRAKQELLNCGAICQINRKDKNGDWTSNMYHVHVSKQKNCTYLLKNEDTYTASDDTYTVDEQTGIITGDEQTYNHIELRTKELNTRTFESEVYDACNYLADLIEDNGSRKPVVTDKWLSDMERINRIDGKSWEQINAAIKWCQNDEFWRANVLSPGKLRKQYETLRLQAMRDQKKSKFSEALSWMSEISWSDQKEIER
jgi:hypothetical protein